MNTSSKTRAMPSEDDLHVARHGNSNGRLLAARANRAKVWARMSEIWKARTKNEKGADQFATASDKREYDALQEIYDEMDVIVTDTELQQARNAPIDRTGVVPKDDAFTPAAAPYRKDRPLAKGQTFEGYARAQGAMRSDGLAEIENEDLSLGKYLRGAMTGDWKDAEAEKILMTQTGATSSAGGVLIPTILSARLIDLARNMTRCLQAGVEVMPMENRVVQVPRWTGDPQPAFRAEGAAIASSDATMDSITLTAKTLSVLTKATRELVEDTTIDQQLERAFAKSFALKLDNQMMYGDGTSNSLTGVKSTAGVVKTATATNGAVATWGNLIDSVGRVRDANFSPNASILADRTARGLAKLADSTGQFIPPPSYLDGVERLSTSQVPINLTQGSSNVASDVFTGQWDQAILGVRMNLTITPLKERFMDSEGAYGFVGWWRGDFALQHTAAFDILTGAL